MKFNNKGFAITGILYTVLVLFLMLLLSILGGLRSKARLLEKNMDDVKESIEKKQDINIEADDITSGVVTSGTSLDCGSYVHTYSFKNPELITRISLVKCTGEFHFYVLDDGKKIGEVALSYNYGDKYGDSSELDFVKYKYAVYEVCFNDNVSCIYG